MIHLYVYIYSKWSDLFESKIVLLGQNYYSYKHDFSEVHPMDPLLSKSA